MSMSWQAGRQKKHPTGKVPRYLVGEKAEGARDKYLSIDDSKIRVQRIR